MRIPFDSLDKKPKVWNLAALAAVYAAGEACLLGFGGEGGRLPAELLTVLFCAAAVALLLRAFLRQLRYNPYSYNTIYYSGFALFALSVCLTHVYTLAERLSGMGERDLLWSLLHASRNYLLLSAPFLTLFSAALFISNVSLIRHEGKRPVNALGMLLALLLLGGEAVLFFVRPDGSFLSELLLSLFAAGYLYFECMLLGTIAAFAIVVHYEPEKDKDVLIVLGCGIRRDGTPTPILRGRLDRALRFAREQEAAGGKAPVFVVSGGQGPDEVISEAACMRRYLLEQGVPEERIITEDRSTDTAQNMAFSKEKLAEAGLGGKLAYATTNYHVFRAGLKARRVKMRAVGMGAATKWYFWPNAAVREFVGLLTEHRLKQALVILGLVAVHVALCVLIF